ncbi:hypothetical protein ACIQFZ_41045 [Streptomyces sp. NPDC093064]|uniref:hypothetical protein n=1 Tax=Streptomyces sp. NPDC093064 TaxID=3366020 RepID=UPI003801B308
MARPGLDPRLSAEDDFFALSLVARGLGMSITPWLSVTDLPPKAALTALGPPPRPARPAAS